CRQCQAEAGPGGGLPLGLGAACGESAVHLAPGAQQDDVALEGAEAEALRQHVDGRRRGLPGAKGLGLDLQAIELVGAGWLVAEQGLQAGELEHQQSLVGGAPVEVERRVHVIVSRRSRKRGGTTPWSMIGLSMPSTRSRTRCAPVSALSMTKSR